MRKINNARNRNGLSSLNWDKQLGYVARQHAQRMASSNSLYHDGQLGERVTRWRRIAQNTGYGGKCRRIFRSFMNSSTHRSNIMGAWRFVGVGTEWRNGCLWVQQVFESRDDPGNVYHYP